MNIQTINLLNFKGHAAGKIKALYMQNPGNQRQISVYNQMREIAQKIYDACYQGQMMSAQNGLTKESSTIWRMKTENEIVCAYFAVLYGIKILPDLFGQGIAASEEFRVVMIQGHTDLGCQLHGKNKKKKRGATAKNSADPSIAFHTIPPIAI